MAQKVINKKLSLRNIFADILRKVNLPSLSNLKPDAFWVLALYITIYSIPNIFGMTSTAQPSLFATWQLVSISLVFGTGLIVMLLQRTLTARYFIFLIPLILSAFLTLLITIQNIGVSKVLSALIPLLLVVMFYLVCGNTNLNPDKFNKLCLYFVFFVTFASIYNILINASSIANLTSATGPYEYNLQSFFENRNAFALLIAVGISLTVYLKSINYFSKLKFAVIIALLLGNLVMTFSRGGILFSAISVLFFYIFYGRFKNFFLYLIITIAILLFSLSYFGSSFIQDNIIRSDSGLTHRDTIQQDSIEYFLSHDTLLGSGESVRTYLKDDYNVTSTHNTYLDILLTGGILKVVAYISLYAIVISRIKMVKRYNREAGSLLMALLITFLIYGTVETATPFLLSPTSAAITVFLFVVPIYMHNYYRTNTLSLNEGIRR